MRKLLLLASLSLACGGDDADPVDPGDGADEFTVSVVNNEFDPSSISVPVGSEVTWQWNSAGVVHNVTFEDAIENSGNMASGTHQRTFSATGDYAYECTIHEGMAGLVSVTASATGGTGSGGGSYP